MGSCKIESSLKILISVILVTEIPIVCVIKRTVKLYFFLGQPVNSGRFFMSGTKWGNLKVKLHSRSVETDHYRSKDVIFIFIRHFFKEIKFLFILVWI